MKTRLNAFLRLTVLLAITALLAGAAGLGGFTAAQAAPADAPAYAASPARSLASLPATTCTLVAPGDRRCGLAAKPGTLTLSDGAIVNIWGLTSNVTQPATVPGPTLIVNQGEVVTVNFTNLIPGEMVSLIFPGQDLRPDLTGAAFNGSRTYIFTANRPGTYSYEAGLTANGPRQTAMGVFGALIVRPAGQPSWAYADANTAFTDEALLVFSEIDPDFNADPLNFDLSLFKPRYFLLNGETYNQTDPISVSQGSTVLLRYINAGLWEHSIGVLGRHQTFIGTDYSQYPFAYTVVAETMGAGQAMDALVTIPTTTTLGTRYPVYNTGLQQNHNAGGLALDGTTAFGGIVTFLDVAGGVAVPDTGPLASNVAATPNPTNSANDVVFSATLDESATGGENVVAAEFFTQTVGAPGTGISFVFTPSVTVNVSATIPAAQLASWEPGDVTFYVRGQDADGTWGPLGSTVLDLITEGPLVRGVILNPNPTNGSLPVAMRATADDTLAGGLNIAAAEYFIDAPGANGSGMAMALNISAPIVEISAVISQPTVDALAEGEHVLYVHAMDAMSNWGPFEVASLWIDRTGPPSTGVSLAPNPNNGTLTLHASSYSIRLLAEIGGLVEVSTIDRAEGFIDTVGSNGAGFPLVAYDALYNTNIEKGFTDIALPTIQLLSEGPHPIYFHGKDSAGNWGAFSSLTLVMDKTAPANQSVNATPNPTAGALTTQLTAAYQDADVTNGNGTSPGSNIIAMEWFTGVDPGAGQGAAMTAQDGFYDSNTETGTALINVSAWANGDYTLKVRAKDAAGNWSAVTNYVLTVSGNVFNSLLTDDFETGLGNWANAVGQIGLAEAASMDDGSLGLRAVISGTESAFLVDVRPAAEKEYRASFLFNPHWSYGQGVEMDIFVAHDSAGTPIFGIQYRDGYEGKSAAVRAWVLANGERVLTDWTPVKNNATHSLAISWSAGAQSMFRLLVNGETAAMLSALNTSGYAVKEVRLGPSGGLADHAYGSQYFDDFVSDRPDAPVLGNKVFLPSITSGFVVK
ncbi:MAG: multicopper oxidase domain-containing protein [Chloroflexi bacterium]|nr:multicopper oxidase domain-containing protein [Chloroflexota bacterium]